MQRGSRPKAKNNNKANSKKGSSHASQQIVNINLGDLIESAAELPKPSPVTKRKTKRKDVPGKAAEKQQPTKKKKIKEKAKPVVKKGVDAASDRMRLLQEFRAKVLAYQETLKDVPTSLLTPDIADIPDRLLTPSSAEEIRETIQWLNRATERLRLLKVSDMGVQRTGISMPSTSFAPRTIPRQTIFRAAADPFIAPQLQERIAQLERELKEREGRTPVRPSAPDRPDVPEQPEQPEQPDQPVQPEQPQEIVVASPEQQQQLQRAESQFATENPLARNIVRLSRAFPGSLVERGLQMVLPAPIMAVLNSVIGAPDAANNYVLQLQRIIGQLQRVFPNLVDLVWDASRNRMSALFGNNSYIDIQNTVPPPPRDAITPAIEYVNEDNQDIQSATNRSPSLSPESTPDRPTVPIDRGTNDRETRVVTGTNREITVYYTAEEGLVASKGWRAGSDPNEIDNYIDKLIQNGEDPVINIDGIGKMFPKEDFSVAGKADVANLLTNNPPPPPSTPPPPIVDTGTYQTILPNPNSRCPYPEHTKLCNQVGLFKKPMCIRQTDKCDIPNQQWIISGADAPRAKNPIDPAPPEDSPPESPPERVELFSSPDVISLGMSGTPSALEPPSPEAVIGTSLPVLAGAIFSAIVARNPAIGARMATLLTRLGATSKAAGAAGTSQTVLTGARLMTILSEESLQTKSVEDIQREISSIKSDIRDLDGVTGTDLQDFDQFAEEIQNIQQDLQESNLANKSPTRIRSDPNDPTYLESKKQLTDLISNVDLVNSYLEQLGLSDEDEQERTDTLTSFRQELPQYEELLNYFRELSNANPKDEPLKEEVAILQEKLSAFMR